MAQGEQIRDAIARADRYMYQAKSHKNAIVAEWGTIAMDDSLPQVNAKKKKRQRILIVDDSEMNREILYEMLKDEFDILEAEMCIRDRTKGVEATIQNIGRLGKEGMRETNEEIIKMMIGE